MKKNERIIQICNKKAIYFELETPPKAQFAISL